MVTYPPTTKPARKGVPGHARPKPHNGFRGIHETEKPTEISGSHCYHPAVKSLRYSTAIRKPARTLPRVGALKTTTSLVIAATAAGLVAAAGPAQADRLPTDPAEGIPHLDGTDDVGNAGYCPFPVTLKIFSVQKGPVTKLPNGATEFRFAGHAEAIVTNDKTGKSITYNISGPGTQTVFPDNSFTIDAAGPNLLWTSVENSKPAGVLQLAYTTGRVQVAVDETGHTTSYQLNGRSTDVCAKLAA